MGEEHMTNFLYTDARWTEHFVEVSDPHKEGHHVRFYFDMAQPKQEPWRESASDYERGVIDGRQMQMQSSVDKAVNAMSRTWIGLTDEEREQVINLNTTTGLWHMAKAIETKLKEKNNG